MIDRPALLKDLQSLLKRLEADLLERSESTEVLEVGQSLHAEYDRAKKAERTAQNYEDWRSGSITQTAAAWVLSCVFVRFLEDNELINSPKISGLGDRLQRARDEAELYFRKHPKETDREYLLSVFDALAKQPGGGVFSHQFSVISLEGGVVSDQSSVISPGSNETENCERKTDNSRNWLSGDAAGEVLQFFQRIDANSGELVHDFTDPDWDTRFLGDLYQDLSEAARKKFALLQTPEFVEEFILDRTLDLALDEFGLVVSHQLSVVSDGTENRELKTDNYFKMIDPACGSGHFLLGSFHRILDRWQRQEPGTNVRDLVQNTLHSIHGVDINPFAIAIARFRLLLAALKACDVTRLVDAPAFHMNLACGDSLYHGRQQQLTLSDDWTDESHYFHTEDAAELRRILKEGTFHCVVANPPYITPKDSAANNAYRRLYRSCHRSYSLAVPFMERIFRLSLSAGNDGLGAGYTGQITANSFMKREFGRKLIEVFFFTVELTHLIDTSGAYVPGHGTPTVILIGRNRKPVANTIRTVMGIRGEPSTPEDPSRGQYWLSVLEHIDAPGTASTFLSVADTARERFESHPWSIGGGGATELRSTVEAAAKTTLNTATDEIGASMVTRADDVYLFPKSGCFRRAIPRSETKQIAIGQMIRDWRIAAPFNGIWPYSPTTWRPSASYETKVALWSWRTLLSERTAFGNSQIERGLSWFEYSMFFVDRVRTEFRIAYPEKAATHNHFALVRSECLFQDSASTIKLNPDATEAAYVQILGLLNSSSACFWLKQVMTDKGNGGIGGGIGDEMWERRFVYDSTKLKRFPLPDVDEWHLHTTTHLDRSAQEGDASPDTVIESWQAQPRGLRSHLADTLRGAGSASRDSLGEMIQLQEELDWQCYQLYGLIDEQLFETQRHGEHREDEGPSSVNSVPLCFPPLQLGQRAFEIVLARKMARGEVQTTWFERHGSTPITELPDHWPDDYKRLVERRIEVIGANPQIALIEQPEYKRRWNTEPWDSQVQRALKSWLLDRLEGYFDFDGRMKEVVSHQSSAVSEEEETESRQLTTDNSPPPLADIALVSVARLADVAARDKQFTEVASVCRDDAAFDVYQLVTELVLGESVPLLPIQRYKPAGLRKRAEWEQTWRLQRLEDRLRAGEDVELAEYDLTEPQHEAVAAWLKNTPPEQRADSRELAAALSIPVPPKYKSGDFISTGGARYWALRGKLDVPKERWISFPHCEGEDGTLTICWAGYNHLQQARAISTFYVEVQEHLGGRDDHRLVPLLACLIELLPWLKQWHNDIDPEYDMAMGDYFEGFVQEEARGMGRTIDEIKAWEPPRKTKGAARKKKLAE